MGHDRGDVAGSHRTLPGPLHDGSFADVDAPILDVSADGRWLAVGLPDGTVALSDLAGDPRPDNRRILSVDGRTTDEMTHAVAFSPDGRQLAARFSGLSQRGLRLWQMDATGALTATATLTPTRTLTNLNEGIRGISFSPDGRWLATTGVDDDKVASRPNRLWDLWADDPASNWIEVRWHRNWPPPEFTPDGRWLAANGEGVYLWPLDPEELIRMACQTAGRNLDEQEWDTFLSGQTYRKTYTGLPANPNVVSEALARAGELVGNGETEVALALLRNGETDVTPEQTVAALLVEKGRTLAGNVAWGSATSKEARAVLEQAPRSTGQRAGWGGGDADPTSGGRPRRTREEQPAGRRNHLCRPAELEQALALDPTVFGAEPGAAMRRCWRPSW